MQLRAVMKKGCAPAVRLVSELIDKDGPDLRPDNRVSGLCDDLTRQI